MTPFAQFIVGHLLRSAREREEEDENNLPERLLDAHCFAFSNEAMELIYDLAFKITFDGLGIGDLAFLPAQKTWIEYINPPHEDWPGSKEGVFLEDSRKGFAEATFASMHDVCEKKNVRGILIDDWQRPTGRKSYWSCRLKEDIKLFHPLFNPNALATKFATCYSEDGVYEDWALIYAMLSVINTPHVIGRRQHMPHRGFERNLLKSRALSGSFPLRSWTEIVLECTPPQDMSDLEGFEAHLTGAKCLHFCRAHLRLKMGRVEFVKAHWRGDVSLGIKRSRYKIQHNQRSAA